VKTGIKCDELENMSRNFAKSSLVAAFNEMSKLDVRKRNENDIML